MASFNRVILAGNLTADPQLRYLPSNTAVCELRLAINHRWRDKEGNQREEVCFVDAKAWGKQGEVLNQYMSKGRPILIEGRLRFEQWTDKEGNKRSKHTVSVENFTFLGSREGGAGGGGEAGGAPAGRAAPQGGYDRGSPPQQGGYRQGGGAGSGGYERGAAAAPAAAGGYPDSAPNAPAYDPGPDSYAQGGPGDDAPPPTSDDIPF